MAKRGTPIGRLQAWEPKGVERYIEGLRHFHPEDVARVISCVGISIPNGRVTVQVNDGQQPSERTIERSEALCQKLNDAACLYEIEANWQDAPSTMDAADALGEIGRNAESLLRALGALPQLPRDLIQKKARLKLEESAAPLAVDVKRISHTILGPLRNHAQIWADKRGNLGVFEILRTGRRGDRIADQLAAHSAVRAAIESLVYLRDWARMSQERRQIGAQSNSRPGRPPDEALSKFFGELKGIWIDIWERAPTASGANTDARHGGGPGGPFPRFCRAVVDHLKIRLTDDGIRDRIRLATAQRRRRMLGKIAAGAS